MKKNFPPPTPISRIILKTIISTDCRYENWFRDFISPREFYFLKRNYSSLGNLPELKKYLLGIQKRLNFTSIDLENLERSFSKLGLLILLYRAGSLCQKVAKKVFYINILNSCILKSRISSTSSINIFKSTDPLNCSYSKDECIYIVAPVCPDYSYQVLTPKLYRYTFEGVGDGIGLVARKAITTINHLLELLQDCPLLLSRIKPIILVGDFEAKSRNLKALNMSFEDFNLKIENSVKAITDETGIRAGKLTDTCGGIEKWLMYEDILRHQLSLRCYDDLAPLYSSIQHDKNLISRIPLYAKWFKNSVDYKKIFFEQVVEYILMGKVISEFYSNSSFLLTSDHRAMRSYYGVKADINIISTSATY